MYSVNSERGKNTKFLKVFNLVLQKQCDRYPIGQLQLDVVLEIGKATIYAWLQFGPNFVQQAQSG